MTQQSELIQALEKPKNVPLAEKARPDKIEDIIGQAVTGATSPLKNMITNDDFSSFILWGPPGTGKTTIARIIERTTSHNFCSFSAVLSKIGQVKELMERADFLLRSENKKTLVFIDEIHRFNKSQQDAFLPYVESGAIILLGATTENPSFEVIPALLSRCHLFVLEMLSQQHIETILVRALDHLSFSVTLEDDVISTIAARCGGDGRKGLNNLEMVCRRADTTLPITKEFVLQTLSTRSLFYDKGGEEHFNLISALQKSIRGSDTQAGLYWLARMLEAGEDPMYIVRRLVRIASEDIGLADPNCLPQAIAVKDAVHFLGMPEATTALTQLVVYLATAPKSNSCEMAYFAAKKDAQETSHLKVPLHICNAPTKTMKDLGYGEGYKYSHNYENSYSYQNYFPEKMKESVYFKPKDIGFEKEIAKRLSWWESLKKKQAGAKDE